MKNIHELDNHMKKYQVYMNKLGSNLQTTVNSYNIASKEFKKIDKDEYSITDKKYGGKIDNLIVENKIIEDEE